MIAKKRSSPRSISRSKTRKRRLAAHARPKKLGARPKTRRPIREAIPRPAVLQRLFPVQSIVTFETGFVPRGESVRNANRLPGFRWDIPAPDPNLGTLIWASLSFDWAFYSWQSWEPQNTGDSSFRLNGSIDWAWYLISNPDFVTEVYTFLQDEGYYSFYMDLAPGDAGFSVGWLTPPRSSTYPDDPRDKRFGPRTPLQALLSTNVDGALRLWFENAYYNQVPDSAYTIGGGPETLYYFTPTLIPPPGLRTNNGHNIKRASVSLCVRLFATDEVIE